MLSKLESHERDAADGARSHADSGETLATTELPSTAVIGTSFAPFQPTNPLLLQLDDTRYAHQQQARVLLLAHAHSFPLFVCVMLRRCCCVFRCKLAWVSWSLFC